MKLSLTLIAFTCLATIAAAQCRDGTCAPVGAPSAYTWRKSAERPDESYLYQGSRQIGGYDHARAIYLPIHCPCGDACQCRACNCKSTWGAECEPPVAPPGESVDCFRRRRVQPQPWQPAPQPEPAPDADDEIIGQKDGKPDTKGVDWTKIPDNTRYQLNGKDVARKEVMQALQKLADDSNKNHLTYIAKSADDRKQFCADCKSPELATVLEKYRVQVYDPTNAIDAAILEPFNLAGDKSFAEAGKMVVIQPPAKNGKAQADVIYQFTATQLAEELRKRDPDWNPNKKKDEEALKKKKDDEERLLPIPIPMPFKNPFAPFFNFDPWKVLAITLMLGLLMVAVIMAARKK